MRKRKKKKCFYKKWSYKTSPVSSQGSFSPSLSIFSHSLPLYYYSLFLFLSYFFLSLSLVFLSFSIPLILYLFLSLFPLLFISCFLYLFLFIFTISFSFSFFSSFFQILFLGSQARTPSELHTCLWIKSHTFLISGGWISIQSKQSNFLVKNWQSIWVSAWHFLLLMQPVVNSGKVEANEARKTKMKLETNELCSKFAKQYDFSCYLPRR